MKGLLGKLLITPVDSYCNMNCGYCYNGSYRKSCVSTPKIISLDTIYRIFDQIYPFLKNDSLTVVWHGGEPLLAGKNFYKEVIDVQKQAAKGRYQIVNNMQTNGTLVDNEWIEIFTHLKIRPSISIDGPQHLHDSIRLYSDGNPTYQKVMQSYRMLQQKDINTGLLMVISKNNVNYPEEIWRWIVKEKIPHFDFLPCIEPELWRKNKLQYSLTSDDMAKFSIRLFDLWFDHKDPNIRIRTFRDAIRGQLGGRVNVCSWKAGCLQHISIDSSGNTFPCARYHCYPETKTGNIVDQNLSEIMISNKTKWVQEGIALGQEKCKNCKWYSICSSGCPFLKYALYGNWGTPYIHCQSRQALFCHVHDRIFQKKTKITQ